MRVLLSVMMAVMFMLSVDSAQAAKKDAGEKAPKEKKAPKPKQPQVPAKEMTLSGVIEAAGKGFVLATADGQKIKLPAKGVENLADLVGKTVTVAAMGTETQKGDKTQIKISKVTSVDVVGNDAEEGGAQDEPIEDGGGMIEDVQVDEEF